jgi:hypothetical protein
MREKKRIATGPVIIGVEGVDYLHLLRLQIMEKPEFSGVQLWDLWDAQYPFERGLSQLLKESAFRLNKVRALGFIRDAETDRRAIEESLRHHIGTTNLPVPNGQMTVAKGNMGMPSTGYLIMPHDKPTGCLENACLGASTLDPQHVACGETFLHCVSQFHNPPLNENWRAKAKVYALIAGSGKHPAMRLGESAQAGVWDFNQPSLKVMLDFILMMRNS